MKNISRSNAPMLAICSLIILTAIFIVLSRPNDLAVDNGLHAQNELNISQDKNGQFNSGPNNQSYLNDRRQARPSKIAQHGDTLATSGKPRCYKDCQNQILEKFAKDGTLSAENANIILQNPERFARQFKDRPSALSALLTTLQHDEEEDNGAQPAARAVFHALPAADKVEVGTVLTASLTAQERISGLKLLAATFETEQAAVNALNKILLKETEPLVLTNALNLTSALPNDIDRRGTLEALTHIIRYNENDHFSGTALMAKVALAPSSQDVYEDVFAALESFSADKTAMGLDAFEFAMERYDAEFENTKGWYADTALQDTILSIANDENADSKTRARAGRLLNDYYYR